MGENRRPIPAEIGNIAEKGIEKRDREREKEREKHPMFRYQVKDSPRETPLPPFKMTIYRKIT